MRILVAGAGIGGLAAANALHRVGHLVEIAEAEPALSPIGAGIILAPNATRVLSRLGVDVSPAGKALTSLDVIDPDGRLLTRLDAAGNAPRYGSTWALTRPDLHRALHGALPPELPVLLGTPVTGVVSSPDAVEVEIGGRTRQFDMVVGADGLGSAVRAAVAGDATIRYSGTTCWRGICPNPGFDRAIESWGGSSRVGVVPLPESRLYYYLVADAPARAPEPAWRDAFVSLFAGHSPGIARFVSSLGAPPPLHHDLNELDRPVWGAGRVFLLGDAAHAMTPNQGQGAAMAIEDAYALAASVGVEDQDIESALRRYVGMRRRRVRTVQLMSRRIGRVAHWTSPFATAVRNAALRAVPARGADAQLRSLVGPGIALAETELPRGPR